MPAWRLSRLRATSSRLEAQFGTALNSGSAVFLYGPPGTGKTTFAETLSHVLSKDDVWIPYAIEIDGQIITVFDPSIHQRSTESSVGEHDERWVLCQRPRILVGGELTIDMLDLQFNPQSQVLRRPRADEGQQRRPHHR
jgi:energy-coupling factor transporter ATP-binding protein EcfA2